MRYGVSVSVKKRVKYVISQLVPIDNGIDSFLVSTLTGEEET